MESRDARERLAVKRLTPVERERRIRELWLDRPRDKRTSADVLHFYYWLSHQDSALVPDGSGSFQQLLTILRDIVIDE